MIYLGDQKMPTVGINIKNHVFKRLLKSKCFKRKHALQALLELRNELVMSTCLVLIEFYSAFITTKFSAEIQTTKNS